MEMLSLYLALKFCPCSMARFRSSRIEVRKETIFPHRGEKGNELGTGRRERCAFAGPLEDRKTDFFLQQFDLIGKGRLTDKKVVSCPAEIQRAAWSVG